MPHNCKKCNDLWPTHILGEGDPSDVLCWTPTAKIDCTDDACNCDSLICEVDDCNCVALDGDGLCEACWLMTK